MAGGDTAGSFTDLVRRFVDLGRDFPEIRFYGYRIAPSRDDERITIEGFLYPSGEEAEELCQRVGEIASLPDVWGREEFEGMMSAWWD